jgi:hypothetical protein
MMKHLMNYITIYLMIKHFEASYKATAQMAFSGLDFPERYPLNLLVACGCNFGKWGTKISK